MALHDLGVLVGHELSAGDQGILDGVQDAGGHRRGKDGEGQARDDAVQLVDAQVLQDGGQFLGVPIELQAGVRGADHPLEVGVDLEHKKPGVGPRPTDDAPGKDPRPRPELGDVSDLAPVDLVQDRAGEIGRAGDDAPHLAGSTDEAPQEDHAFRNP